MSCYFRLRRTPVRRVPLPVRLRPTESFMRTVRQAVVGEKQPHKDGAAAQKSDHVAPSSSSSSGPLLLASTGPTTNQHLLPHRIASEQAQLCLTNFVRFPPVGWGLNLCQRFNPPPNGGNQIYSGDRTRGNFFTRQVVVHGYFALCRMLSVVSIIGKELRGRLVA